MPMREYVCAPRGRVRWAVPAMIGCFLLTAALWVIPALATVSYRPIWFFFSMTALTVALLIAARHCLCRYVYRLCLTEDGGFDFVVDLVRPARTVCVCRIETEAFRAIVREDKRSRMRPNYDWSAGVGDRYLLTLSDGEQEVSVRFTPDATLAAMIATAVAGMNL